MVPPVPTPETSTSIPPFVCSQISGPVVWHRDVKFISSCSSHKGQGNACISARRLDDLHPGFEQPLLFSIPDHTGSYPALDRIGRVTTFNLCKDRGLEPMSHFFNFD